MRLAARLLLLLCPALPALAAEDRVEIAIAVSLEGDGAVPAGKVLLERSDASGTAIDLSVSRSRSSVSLPSGSVWRLTPRFPDLWGPSIDFTAAAGASVSFRLWPAVKARGKLDLAPGEKRAGPLSVRFVRAARPASLGARTLAEQPAGEVEVSVADDGTFELELPAAQLDLRLHRAGYASEWLWEVPVAPRRPLDLGNVKLQRGSSLVGWIRFDEPAPPDLLRQVEVELQAVGTTDSAPRTAARLEKLAQRNRSSDYGLFRFSDVAPGGYRVVAKAPGFAPAEAFPTVVEGREAELLNPLELNRPVEAVVSVDPPVDPEGKPWSVELSAQPPGTSSAVTTHRRAADGGGLARIEGLAPGIYSLGVGSGWGTVHQETVTIERGMAAIEVTLDLFPIAGRVSLAGRPVALELRFGGYMGRRQVTFESDAEGRFQGFLPGSGRWPVAARFPAAGVQYSLEPVLVDRPPRGEAARIDLELPDTQLRGRVTDPLRRSLEAVDIDAARAGGGDPAERRVTLRPDRFGRFSVAGLPEGLYSVVARHGQRRSETAEVEIAAGGDHEDLVLVLGAEKTLRLRIIAGERPVVGATVGAFPSFITPQGPILLAEGVSGPDGMVELRLPGGAVAASVAVFPPAYAARATWIELSDRELIEMDVQVARDAGTLILELPPCGEGTRHGAFRVRHGQQLLLPNHLMGWARMHGQHANSCGRLIVPMMAPGKYDLCAPGQGRCDEGPLDAAGELVLNVAGEGSRGVAAEPQR